MNTHVILKREERERKIGQRSYSTKYKYTRVCKLMPRTRFIMENSMNNHVINTKGS